jgi:hypothetical protein
LFVANNLAHNFAEAARSESSEANGIEVLGLGLRAQLKA